MFQYYCILNILIFYTQNCLKIFVEDTFPSCRSVQKILSKLRKRNWILYRSKTTVREKQTKICKNGSLRNPVLRSQICTCKIHFLLLIPPFIRNYSSEIGQTNPTAPYKSHPRLGLENVKGIPERITDRLELSGKKKIRERKEVLFSRGFCANISIRESLYVFFSAVRYYVFRTDKSDPYSRMSALLKPRAKCYLTILYENQKVSVYWLKICLFKKRKKQFWFEFKFSSTYFPYTNLTNTLSENRTHFERDFCGAQKSTYLFNWFLIDFKIIVISADCSEKMFQQQISFSLLENPEKHTFTKPREIFRGA